MEEDNAKKGGWFSEWTRFIAAVFLCTAISGEILLGKWSFLFVLPLYFLDWVHHRHGGQLWSAYAQHVLRQSWGISKWNASVCVYLYIDFFLLPRYQCALTTCSNLYLSPRLLLQQQPAARVAGDLLNHEYIIVCVYANSEKDNEKREDPILFDRPNFQL